MTIPEMIVEKILELEEGEPTVYRLRVRKAWLALLNSRQLEQLNAARAQLRLEEFHRVQST